MAGHPGYLKLLDEMRALHEAKAADYGRGADPFANVRASAEFGIPAWVGVMVRAGDKLHRIKSLCVNGSLKNESVEDSMMDLAAYALIALVLYREQHAPAARAEISATVTGPPRRRRVYIAGPISKGDLHHNIAQADEAFAALAKAGFAPLCPHWSAFAGSAYRDGCGNVCGVATVTSDLPLSHDDWLGVDLAWVAVADAVLRLPGESRGADRETAEANRRRLPVFSSVGDVIAHFAASAAG